MIVWRISSPHRATDLSGQGAALYGGRWNHPGLPALYTGTTPSVAALESLVHTNSTLPDPIPLVAIKLLLPDDTELYWQPAHSELPDGWSEKPPGQSVREFGSAFLRANDRLGLIVPSAVMPLDNNIILNPNHPMVRDVRIIETYDYKHDSRIYG
ncbi:RES family NAD+ phosphorylase [Alcanivorax sp. 1008]|uniref:RES family NAD+ phosphorylase n=1 Tax=Alcanivorax sp. 1008 TaxID=2816853 RepID=UPI001DF4CAF4|nr:RES family NAD+ phosphorylase [Alcanivorax sp. 1008]